MFTSKSLCALAGAALVALVFVPYVQAQDGTAEAAAPATDEKAPPLPFHTIEGYGGGAITPMAYLVNGGPAGSVFGEPAVSMSYVNLGGMNLDALSVTETLFDRVELGYAADRLGLGNFPDDVRNFTGGGEIRTGDVWMHNFNIRGLLVKENDFTIFDIGVPAVTAGIEFKYNANIADINNRLSGALNGIGYRSSSGEDYTLTTTKTIKEGFFGKPLIATAGLRLSEGADLGLLGFGDTYHATFEGSIAVLPLDNLLVAYEFRQKTDPYNLNLAPLIGTEDNWHAIDVGLIMNKYSTLVVGYGHFGNLANNNADGAWWFQLKYEF